MFFWKFFAKLFKGFWVIPVSIPVIIVMLPVLIIQTVCSGSKPSIQKASQKPAPTGRKKPQSQPASNQKQNKTRKASDLKWIDDLEDLHGALDD